MAKKVFDAYEKRLALNPCKYSHLPSLPLLGHFRF